MFRIKEDKDVTSAKRLPTVVNNICKSESGSVAVGVEQTRVKPPDTCQDM